MKIINVDSITSVEVTDKILVNFTYKEGKKRLLSNTKEGFYEEFGRCAIVWTKEQLIEAGFLVEDKLVYKKPSVIIRTTKEVIEKEFLSLENAVRYAKPIVDKIKNRIEI